MLSKLFWGLFHWRQYTVEVGKDYDRITLTTWVREWDVKTATHWANALDALKAQGWTIVERFYF